ncbi:hypothetical protein HPHPH28_0843 [Helicobacter pylori Hp H-28]|nr:hypothetical protein HPHPH28_0843 [Helicobacter pylori Hp H-28]
MSFIISIYNKNRILITLNRTHLSQTLKAFRILLEGFEALIEKVVWFKL